MVATSEVSSALTFLSDLPIGLASPMGVAAVRTLMAGHRELGLLLQEAVATQATQAARAEAQLREKDAQIRELEVSLNGLRHEEEHRTLAETEFKKTEELLRGREREVESLGTHVEELSDLLAAAISAAQKERERAEAAEEHARACEADLALRSTAIEALEARIAEVGAERDASLANLLHERSRAEGLASTLANRESDLQSVRGEASTTEAKVAELTHAAEAHAAESAVQSALLTSIQREFLERERDVASLSGQVQKLTDEAERITRGLRVIAQALLPFAEMAESYDLADADWVVDSGWCEDRRHSITVANFRAARSAAFALVPGQAASRQLEDAAA